MDYPKVLVISHNPFSETQNNGKTLSAFFEGWPKDKIAQLFFTLDKPDTNICNKYFCISDLDVLKNIFGKKKIGTEYQNITNEFINTKEVVHKNKLYIFVRDLFKKRLPIMNNVRNLVWNFVKPWKEKKINDWLDDFSPDIVFFQSSNMYTIFDVVKYICKRKNIPLIMETTDDYVTAHFSIDPFYWIDYFKISNRYKKAVLYSKCVFAIGNKMAAEYQKRFGGSFKVAMNSIEISNKVTPYIPKKSKAQFVYAGNLGLNRWKVLSNIGKCLYEIKRGNNIDVKLDIYSLDIPNKSILKKLNIDNVVSYKGSLTQDELIKVRNSSDILIHVESFDRKNKDITRLSISTKIPEYLLSKRCILAVGPKGIASIQYILDNNMGEVVSSLNRKKMKSKLMNLIMDEKMRINYIENGISIAQKGHNFIYNRKKVQQEIIDINKSKNNGETKQ